MSRRFGLTFSIATAIGFVLFAYQHLGGQTRTLITQQIDERKLVTLRGNTHPAATSDNDRGPVAESMRMDGVWLLLKRPPDKEKAFAEFVEEQQRPNSPSYHKWLTAKQVGEQFGPSQEDIATVVGWLESSGFTVNHVYPLGTLIDFSGTAGQIQHAFHTEIHNLRREWRSAPFRKRERPADSGRPRTGRGGSSLPSQLHAAARARAQSELHGTQFHAASDRAGRSVENLQFP